MKILNSKPYILYSRFKILGVTLAIGVVFALFQLVGFKTSPETERIIYPQAQLVPLTPNKTLFKSNESPQFTLKLGQKQEEQRLSYSPLKQVFAETEPKVVANVYYGIFQASSDGTFQIAKNFTNNGTFTHNSGTVTLDTTNACILNGSGTPAITFNNLASTTAGKTLQFTEGKTFRIEGLLTITGISGNKIEINSTSSTQWLIDHQGTENITYTNVQNSGCAGGTTNVTLDPTNSNQGNNSACWVFQTGKRVKAGVRIRGGVRIK